VGVSVIQDQAGTSRALLRQCFSRFYHIWMQREVRDLGWIILPHLLFVPL